MKKICIISILLCIILTACGNDLGIIGGADGPTTIIVSEGEKIMYEEITPEEAEKLMDSSEDKVILDVREEDEFNQGHIELLDTLFR